MKPKETPPFAYDIRDPHLDVTYYVFAYAAINTKSEVWSHVARFLGSRKRRMPKSWQNLPKDVKLLVTPDGKVKAFDLPTQKQLEEAQKIQNQRKKRMADFYLKKREKMKRNHHPEKPQKTRRTKMRSTQQP